jgi:hypothetical protein
MGMAYGMVYIGALIEALIEALIGTLVHMHGLGRVGCFIIAAALVRGVQSCSLRCLMVRD